MDKRYFEISTDIRVDYIKNSVGGKMNSVHYHDAYEIYILEKGERNYIIDDAFIELRERDVALIKPYELHSTDGGVFSRYLLYFKEDYLERFFTPTAKKELLAFFKNKKLHISSDDYERLKDMLLKIRSDHNDFILFSQIMKLFIEASKKDVSLEVSEKNKLISRIIEYLANNYLEIRNLDMIAEEFFITKYYLCRLFKNETGVSVITYINTLKLQKACEMLEFTKKNIDTISTECGFNSSMYFCKLFKETMKMRPGDYRKTKQN